MSDGALLRDSTMEPVRATGMVLLAMLTFSVVDATGKYLTDGLDPIQIVWGRYLFILAFLAPLALHLGLRDGLACRNPGLQVVRGLAMLGSALAFVYALSFLPLALATSIAFAAPIFTTALSVLMLGETVHVRRWIAVAVGLAGVVIILRPATGGFELAMLLPVASALLWAIGLIITRKIARDEMPLTTMLFTTVIGLIGTSVLLPPVWVAPGGEQWLLLVMSGAFNVIGQYALIDAFRRAPASMLAPYSYSTMVWAVLFGVAVFGTWPDAATWVGAGVIIGSGLYIGHRERILNRPPVVPNAAISGAKGLARRAR